ncbi:tetratricopeptide repeat protein [uncultured Cohaesibacter sp.]|uniref:tetratricopeptide repeat protein n=1 Tax=uncultured Cohaesibacter sp. TaxID=1002546 RepID=UPI002AA72C3F|nr:tetratricopeptide repeat protein [uncultured Cohaesibacter sp.]
MEDDISFPKFYGLIDKNLIKAEDWEKRKKLYQKIYRVLRDDLQFEEYGFATHKRKIDTFFEGESLEFRWNGSNSNQPFGTIIQLGNGRLGGKKACLLLYWLFMEHPDKCKGIAQYLWQVETLGEQLEIVNAKSNPLREKKSPPNSSDRRNIAKRVHDGNASRKALNLSAFPIFHEIEQNPEIHSYAYVGDDKIPILGREEEEAALKHFLCNEPEKRFQWLQIAGVAGQGKTRLALELIQKANEGEFGDWQAGFWYVPDLRKGRESEAEEFRAFWKSWEPDRSYLLVLDYVIAVNPVVGQALASLITRAETFAHPVRLLLLERQRWDKGGLALALQQSAKKKDQGTRNFVHSEGRASWYDHLVSSIKPANFDRPSLRFDGSGVRELKKLRPEQLREITKQVFNAKKTVDRSIELSDENIEVALQNIDRDGRPLYAYLFASALISGVGKVEWTREGLLEHVVTRDYQKRWVVAFVGERPPRLREAHPALEIALLACMTGGMEIDELVQLSEFENVDDITLKQALILVSGASDNTVLGPAEAIPSLLPDILGEWFALNGLKGRKIDRKNRLVQLAWEIFPEGMERFLTRATQDFPDLVDEMSLYDIIPTNQNAHELRKRSIFNAGVYYHNGIGVEKNLYKAADLYHKAAEYEHIPSMFHLGICYQDLRSDTLNNEKSMYWYEKAAEAGVVVSMLALALNYESGTLVKKDMQKASFWYGRAAEAGDPFAMFEMGICYQNGKGVKKNAVKAAYWYHQAAYAGSIEARATLSVLPIYRDFKSLSISGKESLIVPEVAIIGKWTEKALVQFDWQDVEVNEAEFIASQFALAAALEGKPNLFLNLAITAMRKAPLSFYGKFVALVDVQFSGALGEDLFASALLAPNGAVLLDGTAQRIFSLNRCFLKLDKPKKQKDFLRFMCEFVHSVNGPLHIVESVDEIPFVNNDDIERLIPREARDFPIVLIGEATKESLFNAIVTVNVFENLFSLKVSVNKMGMIEPSDYSAIATNLKVFRRKYSGFFRSALLPFEE